MILMSDEAKRKFCPFTEDFCKGDLCMKWEVHMVQDTAVKSVDKFPHYPIYKETDKGYCGNKC